MNKQGQVHFEWTISLGNVLSILGIISTVGGAVIYVQSVKADVQLVNQKVDNQETLNNLRKQNRDAQMIEIKERLTNIETNVTTIMMVVTKDPRSDNVK